MENILNKGSGTSNNTPGLNNIDIFQFIWIIILIVIIGIIITFCVNASKVNKLFKTIEIAKTNIKKKHEEIIAIIQSILSLFEEQLTEEEIANINPNFKDYHFILENKTDINLLIDDQTKQNEYMKLLGKYDKLSKELKAQHNDFITLFSTLKSKAHSISGKILINFKQSQLIDTYNFSKTLSTELSDLE